MVRPDPAPHGALNMICIDFNESETRVPTILPPQPHY
jgi:hypothetical protein